MCFGNTVEKEKTTKAVDPQLTANAQGNFDYLKGLRDTGYKEYTGPRVADLTADQTNANSMIRGLAGSSDPYTSTIEGAFGNAATAGPSSVSTVRAIDNVPGQGASGSTQDYMDPYLQSVLNPQMRAIDEAQTKQQQSLDRQATMGGAFGDARSGIEASLNTRNGNTLRADTTGKAYSAAYNDAISRKIADLTRMLDVDKTNAALSEQGMARSLAGGQALQGLDKYNTGRAADLAGLQFKAGESERSITQAKYDAAAAEYAKKTGYPLEVAKLMISANQPGAYGSTSTTTGPDNSGYGMVGALAGTALSAALAPATGGLSLAAMPAAAGGFFGGSPESNTMLNPATYGNIA